MNGAFDVMAWANASSTSAWSSTISQYDNGGGALHDANSQFYSAIVNTSDIQFREMDGSFTDATCSGCLTTNAWKRLGGSKPANVSLSGYNTDVYYGTTDTSVHHAGASVLQCPTFEVLIGAVEASGTGGGTTSLWKGSLADLCLWDMVNATSVGTTAPPASFTASELQALQAGQPCQQIRGTFLVHHWALNGISSTEPDDAGPINTTGGGKNGTLHGTGTAMTPINPIVPPVQTEW